MAERVVEGKLQGQIFVITGTLKRGSRDEVAAQLQELGATVKDTVTKDTDYLVVGQDPGGSKVTKAQQYNVKQCEESELLKILG